MEYLVFNKKVKKYFDLTDEKNGIDNNGHGTMMCSLILGNKGLLGIAPEVQLYSYKVVDSSGKVKPQVLARAINRTINDKVNIINISLGSYFENAEKDCDILAPGVDINTTLNTGEMSIAMGTSQATALISAKVAMLTAKIGSICGPAGALIAWAAGFVGAWYFVGPFVSALWDCVMKGKKGIEVKLKKSRWRFYYGFTVYAK